MYVTNRVITQKILDMPYVIPKGSRVEYVSKGAGAGEKLPALVSLDGLPGEVQYRVLTGVGRRIFVPEDAVEKVDDPDFLEQFGKHFLPAFGEGVKSHGLVNFQQMKRFFNHRLMWLAVGFVLGFAFCVVMMAYYLNEP